MDRGFSPYSDPHAAPESPLPLKTPDNVARSGGNRWRVRQSMQLALCLKSTRVAEFVRWLDATSFAKRLAFDLGCGIGVSADVPKTT